MTSTPPKSPGERLRAAREAAGLSQQALADLLEYKSKASIQFLESGKYPLTGKTLKKVAGALGISPDDLNPDDAQRAAVKNDLRVLVTEFRHRLDAIERRLAATDDCDRTAA